MSIQVYINFNGNCREAVEYYAEVFGTEKPQIMTYGEAPSDQEFNLSKEAEELVLHARLNICGGNVMFSDVFPGMPYDVGNNISLSIVSTNIEEIKSYFNKLKDGGSVEMELQETFWSKCYGSLTDKFGIKWQLTHDDGQRGT